MSDGAKPTHITTDEGLIIPEAWAKHTLRDHLNAPLIWSSFTSGAALPLLPWHTRWRLKLRYKWSDARERIAQLVYPEGPWDGEDW